MKKIQLLLIVLISFFVTSCATAGYAQRSVREMDEVSYILANYYPELHAYYMEGVLDVDSLREVRLEDGTVDYKVKYHFIKYYYRNHTEMIEVLNTHFPDYYQMYINGIIRIRGIYKYVEKNTGMIKYHVLYSRVYDFYYEWIPAPYNATRLQYRPRPMPLPRYEPTPPRRPHYGPGHGPRTHRNGPQPRRGRR